MLSRVLALLGDAAFRRRATIVLLAYWVTGRLGLVLAPLVGSHITLLWLPSGIAVAAMLRWGRRMALPVLVAATVVNAQTSPIGWGAAMVGVGNALGPLLAVRILQRGAFDRRFSRPSDIVLFLWATGVGMLVTSCNGATALFAAGALPSGTVARAWFGWWLGDAVGVVLAGVPLLVYSRKALRACLAPGTLVLWASVAVVALAGFARAVPLGDALLLPLLALPFVIMATMAMRQGLFRSSVAVLLMALVAAAGTLHGLGPFAAQGTGGLFALWGYVLALACTTLMVCALAGELASSRKRMLALFAHAHDGLLLVDERGRIAQAKPAAAVLLGTDAMALRGVPLWHLEVGVRQPEESALLRLVERLAAPAITPVHAGRLRRVDGAEFDGECQVATYTDSAGVTQAHVVVRDITERLRAEADRLAADAAVRANQAKTEFLSRMSHELRTPLNAVLGFAQLLEREATRMPKDWRGNVRHIVHAGTHLLHLIDEVLDLSRIEAGGVELRLEPVPLAQVIDDSLAVVRPAAARRRVTLQAAAAPGDERLGVVADATRLHQVLVNLLDNAVKYTAAGGRVWIGARPLVDERGRDIVAIEVGDTGVGLAPEQIAHLFEPFNRLGAERAGIEGTGIGLVISRRFVELMDGRLRVESERGVGSLFRIELPAAGPDAAATDGAPLPEFVNSLRTPLLFASPSAGPARGAAPARRRVLYVEDNEVNLLLVEAILGPREHLDLVTAVTGQEGLASACAVPPDLVLIDMQLPDMTGLALYRLLRGLPGMRGVPCVAVSADAMPATIEAALGEGFADYLTKPIALDSFNACIDRHLPPR
jgi:PAS domain S-box-containing protein